ncbi:MULTISPECIES: hypothetical protein [Brachybacterium]|uniref:hypothetical protein n=1 Tax=Brachybacterium TaxID=43668 RepID=UPI0010DD38C9|nr:hypothetical protein [Brachybacterium sp. AG952]MDV3294904.1 hypothetical protein [Brachybacterium paraconglomeratum]TDP79674.1 hypothetical protein DEU31_0078 [Brachybacterium sp. AG952]
MTESFDPESTTQGEDGPLGEDQWQDVDQVQGQDPAPDSDEVSIDDTLEFDRAAAEGPEERLVDAHGIDTDMARGADGATAAEQGNRDEDRMEADVDDEQLDEIAREDGGLDEILPEEEPPLP